MARQQYGVSPWGAWFIDILDGYEMGARIDRGRSYANTGKVRDFALEGRTVNAKVAGHYKPFYKVKIDFPVLADEDEKKLQEIIEDAPAILAEIASGVLSDAFLDALKKNKIDLIPKRWDDMKRSCNCPDWGDPCKHQAAVYFTLARAIDSDPAILFKLRGVDLSRLAAAYNADISTAAIPPPFTVKAAAKAKAKSAAQEQPVNADAEIPFFDIPSCVNLILALLPPRPAFYPPEKNFALVLAEFYHEAAAYRSWLSSGINMDDKSGAHSYWKLVCKKAKDTHECAPELIVVEETPDGNRKEHGIYETFITLSNAESRRGSRSWTLLCKLFKFIQALIAAGAFVPYPLVHKEKLRIIYLIYEHLLVISEYKASLAREADKLLLLDEAKNIYADGITAVNIISSRLLCIWTAKLFFAYKTATAAERPLLGLFFQGEEIDVHAPSQASLPLAVWRYVSVFSINFHAYKYRITLKEGAKKNDTAIGDISLKMLMDVLLPQKTTEDETTNSKIIALKDAAQKTHSLEVLKAPTALSAYMPEIKALTEKKSITLAEERLAVFMDEASLLLSKLGIEAVLPKSLKRILKPRLVLQTDAKKGDNLKFTSYLDLPSLLEWNWRVAIGDEVLSADEFKLLLAQKRSIVRFRDKYISLDSAELASLLKSAENSSLNKETAVNEFLKTYFSGDALLSFDAEKIIERVTLECVDDAPLALRATLRPYQLAGFRWIRSLFNAGFGCILADDMGLGKTVQAIAVLLALHAEGRLEKHCLIVAPASLIENWCAELARFAPALSVVRYHGKDRTLRTAGDCYITTYQTAMHDEAKLVEFDFSLLIVDEAHLIKNADAKISKTIKNLRPAFRLALSGTPVENRLEDMRSLFDFVLPGYLGTREDFVKRYRKPIEVMRNASVADSLRKITAPFLLRRLKTDKSIIADLPDKITTNEYSILQKEQAALYESVIAQNMEKLDAMKDEDGGARAGLIFPLLTALKQICDHPRVYDKESPPESSLSGKAELLLTLLEEALESGEKTIVFSQYIDTLECLHTMIKKELHEDALIYNGTMNAKKRSSVVDCFQTDSEARIMLISLKAGGLGLNLTAASRVIHFDLWYNPAVEAQATDRAFRIGQKRNVFVHRFITKNSFEEKIDAMLTGKKELADLTVQSGEAWLSRLSRAELKELFTAPV